MQGPWRRTRGHPFDDFPPRLRLACLERLRWDCERRGYTLKTVPWRIKGSLVGKIRCHALHHYSAAYMRHLAAERSGYAAQRKYREEIASGKRREHPIHAARRIALCKKCGEKRLRKQAERHAQSGQQPKPRVSSTLFDDDRRMHAFRPPLPPDAVRFSPPALSTDNASRHSRSRSNLLDLGIEPWPGHGPDW